MSSVVQRLDTIADCEFTGPRVPQQIAEYASLTQRLAHDTVRELDSAEARCRAALRQLARSEPSLLGGVNVRLRARKVTKVFREMREMAMAMSKEAVAFNVAFRREFGDALTGRPAKPRPGSVTL